jgi:hypothetical protein
MTQIGKAIEDSTDTMTAVDTAVPTSKAVRDYAAPLVSPALTGNPTAPTPAAGDNNGSIATTGFVQGEKVLPHPTLIATTVASKGGVFNGDFELGSGSVTSTGWIGSENYGWYATITAAANASFDSTVSHSGKQSLKLSTTDGTGKLYATCGAAATVTTIKKYCCPIKATTNYKTVVWIKTKGVAADAVYYTVIQYDNNANVLATTTSTKITGTTDWQPIVAAFTSEVGASFVRVVCWNFIVSATATDAWFDDVALEEVVEDTTNTSQIPTPLLSTITGVTSVDNIDVFKTGGTSYSNTVTSYWYAQQFQPTKNKITTVKFKLAKVGAPTGNLTVAIETDSANTPSGTILASITFDVATLTTSIVEYTFNVPCLWTSGKLWATLKRPSADGDTNYILIQVSAVGTYSDYIGIGAGSWSTLSTAYEFCSVFTYAKPTENATIVCNGEKIAINADKDGLLHGAIIDLDKGTYYYNGELTNYTTLVSPTLEKLSDVYAASSGARSTTYPFVINDWSLSSGSSTYPFFVSLSDTTERYITYKVNTLLPIKHLMLHTELYSYSTDPVNVQISSDGINWTSLRTVIVGGSVIVAEKTHTDLMNGLSTFFIRFYKAAGTVAEHLGGSIRSIEADLDTSSITLPIIYPLAVNQFTEEVVIPKTASRVYYQTAKYMNNNGVVIPHLEFTDASAVVLKAIPCKLDNTGEGTPAINIMVDDTTYGQQSGTGSAPSGITSEYILNNGEYMTFSTATQYVKITYKVGGGTTTFSNITRNRVYLSSNGSADSATKDPSHQMGVNLWYRVQSVARTVSDIAEKINNVVFGLPKFNASYVADGGTINHNLGRLPCVIIANASVASQIISITAKDVNTFTVAIKTDAGASGTTQTIYWMAI